ncbi:PP2C family protein-serine/threonine phosphatase [Agromyces mangrovi Wang et al. 2018]|uniref:PP2C family protein-serine/threonine phosphatase n=1 Tax=Agromyces mangrovi TaxID=1858653 RepID=UPI0025729FED|nr:protein phosphatase 2C domain-containing protein [Agromyces mangrovi]BDZ65916.1 serine/threonine protein phosphatase [Agromyces mangrovi]
MTQIGHGNPGTTVTLPNGTEVTLAWAALTDTGLRREVNEDSFVARPPVFAVADGMGGHAAGDFASAAVVTRLAEHGGRSTVLPAEIGRSLTAAVGDMERSIGVTDEGSGTTVTGVALMTDEGAPAWSVFNIGDSRVYRLLEGELEQLTVDHSIVQELVDAGHITQEEAEVHPHSNVITRAVGFHETPVPDYRTVPLVEGMRLLACSDGLTKELTPYGIRHFLLGSPKPEAAARALMDAALGNGGRDNVTVVVLDVLRIRAGEPGESSPDAG